MRGGFSLTLSRDPKRSHIQLKRINAGSAFIRLTIPAGVNPEKRNQNNGGGTPNHHGYFLDTAILGGALFGGRPALKRLAKLLDTPIQKADAQHGEDITPDYLGYLRTDVQVTVECAAALFERYGAYDLPKEPWQIHSEAGIGKAHLEKTGTVPFRECNAWPDHVLATVMETYYGGRAECMVRRTPVPGTYVDFKSQYPTAYCLQGLHRYVFAEQVNYCQEDPREVQDLLDRITVDDVLDPMLWPTLDALILIAPQGDRLPTRTRFSRRPPRGAQKRKPRSMNVGVPFRSGGPPQWYTLADGIASKLMTGSAPRVLDVRRFRAGPRQSGLSAIDIAGNSAYRVDPTAEDFIGRLVEQRADAKRASELTGDAGEAARLDAGQLAMKVTANSAAYGSPIEINPIEHRKPVWITVHLPNGSSYKTSVHRTEQPGKWFHPLIATLVAAGGRLLLAAAMSLVADHGGHYSFCDTDSLFIVSTEDGNDIPCRGGTRTTPDGRAAIKSLTWEAVDAIVERFSALNPYRTISGSILEIEGENYDADGNRREIECFAIASKRYCLSTRGPHGRPRLIATGEKLKRSEHGLGHLLSPYGPNPDENEQGRWMDEWWQHLLNIELGFDDPAPVWFAEPAIGRVTVTSPRDVATFRTFNANRSYAAQVKPWGFLCLAHPKPHERARANGTGCLIGQFEREPKARSAMAWIDRDHPERGPQHISTSGDYEIRPGRISVLSYGNYFANYREHPESKAADPTDGQPCHTWTRGLLTPRHIQATTLVRVGKESNRLSDNPAEDRTPEGDVTEYPAPDRKCRGCEARVGGRRRWCSEVCRKRSGRRGDRQT